MSKSYSVLIVGTLLPWLSIGVAEIMKLKGINQLLIDKVVLTGLITGILACLYYLTPSRAKTSRDEKIR